MEEATSAEALLTFQDAFERFQAIITPEDRRLFETTTLHDVEEEVLSFEKRLAARPTSRNMRCLRNMRSLQPYLQSLEQYSKIVDTLCSGTPFLCPIWGPVKLMLMITTDHPSAFETFIEAHSMLAAAMPRLDRLPESVWHNPNRQSSLALIYADILEFNRYAYRLLRSKLWVNHFGSMWANFTPRFDSILSDLAYHSELLGEETTTVDFSEAVSRSRQERQRWERHEREQQFSKLQSVLSWLGSDDIPLEDELEKLLRDGLPGSCDWILQHPEIQSWWKSGAENRLVWLYGKPGAGKSVICSRLIQLIQHGEEDGVDVNVFFYFCTYRGNPSDNSTRLLQSLASQIIHKHHELADYVHDFYVQYHQFPSREVLRGLLPELFRGVGSAHLIVDGIDKWDSHEQTICLEDLLWILSTDYSSYNCKVLVSSRDVLAISRCLRKRHGPITTISLSDERDAIDRSIAMFIDKRLSDLQDHLRGLGLDNFALEQLRRALLGNSNGMFLWVRLVLDSFELVYSLEDLGKLTEEPPSDFADFYKNILRRLRSSCNKKIYERVTQVFSRICFAQRPLQTPELLRGLAAEPGNALPDSQDTVTPQILDHCKPLIEVRSDSTVHFIHFTVKEYLLRFDSTGVIQRPQVDSTPAGGVATNPDTTPFIPLRELIDQAIRRNASITTHEATHEDSSSTFSSEGYTFHTVLSTLPTSLHDDANYTIDPRTQEVRLDVRSKGDADIRSVLSAEDSDESQSAISNADPDQRRNEIINGIVIVLATNATLIPLYEKALLLVPKHRFVNNFRRLLKVFRNNLIELPRNRVTQELTSLLRSRDTQMAIANRVVERQASSGNPLSEQDMIRFQGSDESTFLKLERLFTKGGIPPPPPSEPALPPPDVLEDSDSDDDYHSDDGDHENQEEITVEQEISQRPRVDQVIHTLVTSQPFQDLILGLEEFVLPHGLLHDILPIPRDLIRFSSAKKAFFWNQIQLWFEDVTALEWNWWPLTPPMLPLLEGETRVHWRCFCGTIRWRTLKAAQKDLLVDILRRPPTISRRPLLCASLYSHAMRASPQPRSAPASGSQSINLSSSLSGISPPTTVYSSIGNNGLASQSSNNTNHGQTPTGIFGAPTHTSIQVGYQQKKSLWFIFKIEGPRSTPTWAQFGDEDLGSDRIFQQKLKQGHHRLRGRLRIWFSYWQLGYWEFVKLQKTRPGRIVDRGPDLPDSPEYEYSPRPPKVTVEDPWISRHEFEEIVNSCITPCWLMSVPNILGIHDCACPADDATRVVGALPKRFSEFKINDSNETEDYMWGIHARYVVSAIRVFAIHVAILAVTIGLWIWWQRKHPDDIQGASVPVTVAGICISTFWASTGILKGLR